MSYVDIKKLIATADSSSTGREKSRMLGVPKFTEGSPKSWWKWGPGVPIFMGSPKFYDTGSQTPPVPVPVPVPHAHHMTFWRPLPLNSAWQHAGKICKVGPYLSNPLELWDTYVRVVVREASLNPWLGATFTNTTMHEFACRVSAADTVIRACALNSQRGRFINAPIS